MKYSIISHLILTKKQTKLKCCTEKNVKNEPFIQYLAEPLWGMGTASRHLGYDDTGFAHLD